MGRPLHSRAAAKPLYTAAQRARRDGSVWTLVQGILALLVFVVSFYFYPLAFYVYAAHRY